MTRSKVWNTYHFLKPAEGGHMGLREAVKLLRRANITVFTASSYLIGHSAVLVEGGIRTQKKAETILFGSPIHSHTTRSR